MYRVGDRVGPYELVELLAVRPQANLWRATRIAALTRGQREVVLRVVHEADDARAIAALRQEYDTLRAIDDPRIRKAHGFYAGFGALALEFVDGVSLTWAIQEVQAGRAEMELATVIDVAIEIANGLRVVHDAGVVHGRVCADTVRLRRDGGIVLTDFTLPLDRLPILPPELGMGHPATAATDQWLLGALICHLLLGEALLGGTSGAPADGNRDLDPSIQRIQATWPPLGRWLVKALAPDPRERYAAEGLLVKDLLSALRTSDNPPRRDALARRLHSGRPAAPLAVPRSESLRVPTWASDAPSPRSLAPASRTPEAPRALMPQPSPVAEHRLPLSDSPVHTPEILEDPPRLALPSPPTAPEKPQTPPPMAAPALDPLPTRKKKAMDPALLDTLPNEMHALRPVRVALPSAGIPLARVRTGDPDAPIPREQRAHSYSSEAPRLSAVVDEEEPQTPDIERTAATESAARAPRLVPDWAAAWALVLLLAVGLWAVLVRLL